MARNNHKTLYLALLFSGLVSAENNPPMPNTYELFALGQILKVPSVFMVDSGALKSGTIKLVDRSEIHSGKLPILVIRGLEHPIEIQQNECGKLEFYQYESQGMNLIHVLSRNQSLVGYDSDEKQIRSMFNRSPECIFIRTTVEKFINRLGKQ